MDLRHLGRSILAAGREVHGVIEFPVKYTRGQHTPRHGRVYAKASLQSVKKSVRAMLVEGLGLTDVDQVNAIPRLMANFVRREHHEAHFESLLEYVEDRDTLIARVVDASGCSPADAKQLFLRVIFGGTLEPWEREAAATVPRGSGIYRFVARFTEETRRFAEHFEHSHFRTMHDTRTDAQLRKQKTNPRTHYMCLYFQDRECQVLAAIHNAAVAAGHTPRTLIHDGLFVQFAPGADAERFLRACELKIRAALGEDVQLAIKDAPAAQSLDALVQAIDGARTSHPPEYERGSQNDDAFLEHLLALTGGRIAVVLGKRIECWVASKDHIWTEGKAGFYQVCRELFADCPFGTSAQMMDRLFALLPAHPEVHVPAFEKNLLKDFEVPLSNGALWVADGGLVRRAALEQHVTQTWHVEPALVDADLAPEMAAIEADLRRMYPGALYEAVGARLCDALFRRGNAHKQFYSFEGDGNNGKTTMFKLLYKAAPMWVDFTRADNLCSRPEGGAHTDWLHKAMTKRILVLEECSKTKKLDTDLVKDLRGAGVQSVRPIYGNEYAAKPDFTLFFLSNNPLRFTQLDEALLDSCQSIESPAVFVDDVAQLRRKKPYVKYAYPKDAQMEARYEPQRMHAALLKTLAQFARPVGAALPPVPAEFKHEDELVADADALDEAFTEAFEVTGQLDTDWTSNEDIQLHLATVLRDVDMRALSRCITKRHARRVKKGLRKVDGKARRGWWGVRRVSPY